MWLEPTHWLTDSEMQCMKSSLRADLNICKKRKENFALFSDHNGSLLSRLPRDEYMHSMLLALFSVTIWPNVLM